MFKLFTSDLFTADCNKKTRLGLLCVLFLSVLFAPTVKASVIWTPMWDMRWNAMTWEVKASDSTLTVNAFHATYGSFKITEMDGTLLTTVAGTDDVSSGAVAVTPGTTYKLSYTGGFHVRPYVVGAEWLRLGDGRQAAGPGNNIGFTSDAELGFDHRWATLPSKFADTTWYYDVAAGETLSISVEHMTGDGSGRFEWISPSNVVTVADATGMPGSGTAHYQARGSSLGNAPNTSSVYWEEYVAPVSEAGFWGFKLYSKPTPLVPYAFHYVLDRTDTGADQRHYLLAGSLLAPTVPEPATLALLGLGLAGMGFGRRKKT